MSLFNVFEISGTALNAQSMRLNAIASNLANAGVVSGSAEEAYRARYPVFSNIYLSNVNSVEEMANMISASRSYQSSVEAMNTTKQLIMRTLSLGK